MASDEKIDASASNAASKAPRSVPDNIDELWDALMDTIPEIEPEVNEPKTLWRRISDCFWYCDSSVFMIIFGLFPLILGIVIAEGVSYCARPQKFLIYRCNGNSR